MRVTDASGAPVIAQVSLGVIDEAVYAIRPDSTPDPVRFFYRREYTRVGTSFSRDYYFVGYSGTERLQLAARRRRPFTLADFKGDKQVQPQVRKDFPDAIFWIGDLVTDAAGQAKVSLKYPDALTTWRLTARAVTRDTRAGTGVARTTTTKDLIVRVITPRFLTEGDEVVVPTIVHNYLEGAKDTNVTVRGEGARTADARRRGSADIDDGQHRDQRRAPRRLAVPCVNRRQRDDDGNGADGCRRRCGGAARSRCCRTDCGATWARAAPCEPLASRRPTSPFPQASNTASRTVSVSLAPSMAGSLLGALDFLTSLSRTAARNRRSRASCRT